MFRSASTALAFLALALPAVAQQHSELWGERGEKWSPGGRLPDFSFAGYHFGEDALPDVGFVTSVREFGALGDGEHDDTEAFRKAIAVTEAGAIHVPAGRYLITDQLVIDEPGIVLRGDGSERTVLWFPRPLEAIRPKPSETSGGRPTSGYSWSGGLLTVKGKLGTRPLARVVRDAKRGDRTVYVDSIEGLGAGDRVHVSVEDDESKSLLDHLYSGEPGDTSKYTRTARARMVSRILSVGEDRVELERPLRFDLRTDWEPQLQSFRPTTREVGIERLAIEFPDRAYEGHFTETGFNGIAFQGAADCWVRDVRITNSDSGIFASGMFLTLEGIVIDSVRKPHRGTTGHHGITLGTDCVLRDFDFRTHFIHDVTVSNQAMGNVVKNGRGVNLSLDHHKRAPYENLFCNLDAGAGTELWRCGGGAALGKHCGGRGTFWCIRADRDLKRPGANFGPASINLVGVRSSAPSELDVEGKWFEAIPPNELKPADLHAAQLERRLAAKR